MFKIISFAVVNAIQLKGELLLKDGQVSSEAPIEVECPGFDSQDGFGKIQTLSAGQQVGKAQARNNFDDVLEEYWTKSNNWENQNEKRDYTVDGVNTETINIHGKFDSRDEISNSMWANTGVKGDAKTTYKRTASQHLGTTTDEVPLGNKKLCNH